MDRNGSSSAPTLRLAAGMGKAVARCKKLVDHAVFYFLALELVALRPLSSRCSADNGVTISGSMSRSTMLLTAWTSTPKPTGASRPSDGLEGAEGRNHRELGHRP